MTAPGIFVEMTALTSLRLVLCNMRNRRLVLHPFHLLPPVVLLASNHKQAGQECHFNKIPS